VARTRIGVDVGSTALRVAEVAAGGIPVIVRTAQVPLPPGVVEAAELRRPEAVAEALRELWSKAGVKSRQVHLGVENQRAAVRELPLPWLPEKISRFSVAPRASPGTPERPRSRRV
jgi:type IV pilus assembly protein PilM